MFLMDYITALITFICIGVLYMTVKARAPKVNWGSSTQSQSFMVALQSIQALSKVQDHVKNYRPKILLVSGNPGDRPILMDFASLLTKKMSLLQCVRVIDLDHDMRRMQLCQELGNTWLKQNKIKAFYHVTRASSLAHGIRQAMELCGLGKMSPNMLLFGFKTKWLADLKDTEAYYNSLVMAFENSMAMAILRVRGGLDASEIFGNKSMLEKRHDSANKGSSDSSSDDEDDSKPQQRSSNQDSAMPLLPMSMFRNPLHKENQEIVARLKQFRGKESLAGTIDIYWLYDDGGLSLLLPHLMRNHAKFSKCQLRVFFLSNNPSNVVIETHRMSDMIAKFRIEVLTVGLLKDIDTAPSKSTEDVFNGLIKRAQRQCSKDPAHADLLNDASLEAQAEKTRFHLRLAEIMKEKSSKAAMVVTTLALPTKNETRFPLYMAWMDLLSRDMPPFLFIRGNQESVLTMYS